MLMAAAFLTGEQIGYGDAAVVTLMGLFVTADIAVSYTHLDVYKRQIFNSLRKLDVLQELVDDRDVTEIMVNGPNDRCV